MMILEMLIKGFSRKVAVDVITGEFVWDFSEEGL